MQDGRILLRRDVGSDFVLQPLANGNLVGIDHDNRFGYYERMDKAASQCQPPAVFVEIPQPLDCPTVARKGGAAACCDDGKLLGCKVAGEELHRADKWQQAQPYFIKLCSAGVRDGCLGLAAGYVHTGDPKVRQEFRMLSHTGRSQRADTFRAAGMGEIQIRTDQSYVDPIVRYFRAK